MIKFIIGIVGSTSIGREEEQPPHTLVCGSSESKQIAAEYETAYRECRKSWGLRSEQCPEEGQSIRISDSVELQIGRVIATGSYGEVRKTNHESLLVKYADICHEKAIMAALDGFPLPKTYKITSTIPPSCHSRMLVMDSVGDADWGSAMQSPEKVSVREGFIRFSSLLKALKALHFSGFEHNDLHIENIRIVRDDPHYIRLIDLGLARPCVSCRGDRDFVHLISFLSLFLEKKVETGDLEEKTRNWLMDVVTVILLHPERECADYDFCLWIFDTLSDDISSEHRIRDIAVPLISTRYRDWAIKGPQELDENLLLRFPLSVKLDWRPETFTQFSTYPSSLHPRLLEVIRKQEDSDSVNEPPYLAFDAEVMGGQILLLPNKWLAALEHDNFESNTYRVSVKVGNLPNHTLEYRVNCESLDDNLLVTQREFGISHLGPSLGVGPGAVWLSPAVKLPSWRSRKLSFTMTDEEYNECAKDPRSHLRFIVHQNVSERTYIRYDKRIKDEKDVRSRLRTGIRIGIDLMNKLRRLHDAGVVHGSINLSSIVRLNGGGDEFGIAYSSKSFFDGEEGREAIHSKNFPCVLTHWNIEGSGLGFRDDTLNVLLVAAWIVTRETHSSFCVTSRRSVSDIAKWKREEFVFDSFNDGRDPKDLIAGALSDNNAAAAVRSSLNEALKVARSVESVRSKPDYDSIIKHLSTALHVISSLNT